MGMFPATTQRDIEAAFQKELDAEPLPFGEGYTAVREFTDLTGRSDSLSAQVKDRTVRSLQALTDHTGEQFAVPDGTWSNRQAMQQLATLDQRKDAIAALRTPEFGPPDLRLQTGAEIQGAAREDVAAAQAKASRAGLGAQLAGGAVSSLTDPLNMALLPLGVFSAEGIMAKLGIEFAIGAGSQTLVEAASAPAKGFAGVEQTAGETATNILATGVLGAGLVGVLHGAGLVARRVGMLDAYHAKVRTGEIVPNRETTAAADAIQDALDTIPPSVSPEAEGAHLDAVAAGTDVLRAESDGERAAALKRLDEAAARAPIPVSAIETPEFKAWFGGSTVRDESGAPMVVYHGTKSGDIQEFNTPSWFTTNTAEASRYAGTKDGGAVVPAYLSIRNPATVPFQDFINASSGLRERLAAEGYDGMAIKRTPNPWREGDGDATWFVPFRPEQVKSVFNRGAFDPKSPSITDYVPVRDKGAESAVSAELASPTPHVEAPDPAAPLAKATKLPSGPNEGEPAAVGATSAESPPAYSSGDPEADALLGRLLTDDPDAAVTIEVDGVETTGRLADVNAALDRELAELDGTTDCLIGGGF